MAIKLTDKKVRTAILFLTLFLVVHIFITAFPVSEIIKQEKYSNFEREVYFKINRGYIEDFYSFVSKTIREKQLSVMITNGVTEEEVKKILLNLKNIDFFKDNNDYFKDDREKVTKYLETEHKAVEEILFNMNKKYDGFKDLKYYFTDEKKVVYSNINDYIEDYIKGQSLYYFKYNSDEIVETDGMSTYYIQQMPIVGYIIVPKQLPNDSKIYNDFGKIENDRKEAVTTLIIFTVELLSTILLILLIIKKKLYVQFKDNSSNFMKYYFKINFEIRVFIILLFTYIMLVVGECYYNTLPSLKIILVACFALFLQFLFYIFLSYFNKNNSINNRDKSIIYNFYRNLKLVRNLNKLYIKVFFSIFMSMIIGAIIISLPMIKYNNHYSYNNIYTYSTSTKFKIIFILIVFFMIPLFSYIIKKFLKINKLIKSIENISVENLECNIDFKENDEFFNAYKSIKNIKASIESSVEERLKSERLKTELITNVSHDLKTPLTSIINYVDLMKKNNLSEEDYKSYLEIIDKKSKRLKILIEDLFEASKLNSGDIELNKEKIDLVSLIKQTLGEFEKQIENSQLELILKLPDEKVYLELDGKKTWRVFENILNNIFKYSQKNTRIYLELIENEKQVMVITKNISAYQLNINPEELFEKFKRGDESRNTEGSGLGLSIAKGIMELHGGEMKIEVDGDLFKNILVFNKAF